MQWNLRFFLAVFMMVSLAIGIVPTATAQVVPLTVGEFVSLYNRDCTPGQPGVLIASLDRLFEDRQLGNGALGGGSPVGGWQLPAQTIVWTNTLGAAVLRSDGSAAGPDAFVALCTQGAWGVFYNATNGSLKMPNGGRFTYSERPLTKSDLNIFGLPNGTTTTTTVVTTTAQPIFVEVFAPHSEPGALISGSCEALFAENDDNRSRGLIGQVERRWHFSWVASVQGILLEEALQTELNEYHRSRTIHCLLNPTTTGIPEGHHVVVHSLGRQDIGVARGDSWFHEWEPGDFGVGFAAYVVRD